MNKDQSKQNNKSDLRFDLNRYKQASQVAYDYAKKRAENENQTETEEAP
jgi:hypothetical protein